MNAWLQHVKDYQKKHGCSYKTAMQKAKATYNSTSTKKTKKKKGGARRIAPQLVTVAAEPDKAFQPDDTSTGIGSAAWKKRKEKADADFFKDLESKIMNKEGAFGQDKYLKDYNLADGEALPEESKKAKPKKPKAKKSKATKPKKSQSHKT
jgi:hypothetical protein